MENKICKFCEGSGKASYFDFKKCWESSCNKNLKEGEKCLVDNCKIAHGVDICPDCNGVGYIVKEELVMQN